MTAPPLPPETAYARTESVTLFTPDHPFVFETGASLAPVTVAYETYGTLNAGRDNAVLVCHALTGSAHAAGLSSAEPRSAHAAGLSSAEPRSAHAPGLSLAEPRGAGWWDPMIGPGRPLDTSRYCVVCSNFLGSCYGTTGPTSTDPHTGRPYGMTFPEYTVRDMVRLQKALMDHLGVSRLRTVIGGSLGGMQALEWPLMYPGMVASIIPIATATQHSPWCIGLNDLARQAIMLDPAWKNGAYDPEVQPERGLSLARQIAMMSYRSDESFQARFRRDPVVNGETVPLADPQYSPLYQVERYLRYQGKKLVDRFDANTYLSITRAMDSHDVAAGRGPLADVLRSIHQPALCVGISSDVLYPAHEQRVIAASLPSSRYRELDAPHGHDAFLISYELLGPMVSEFLEECA